MKTKLLLIVTLFTLCFTANVYSTCPSGYLETSETITVNGCDYLVTICYTCVIGPSMYDNVKVIEFDKIDDNCEQTWGINQVLRAIYDQVYTASFYQYLCSKISPCGTGFYVYVNYHFSKCWKKMNISGNIRYVICEENNCYCDETWKFCYDAQYGWVPEQVSGPTPNCETDCTDPEPADPLEGNTTGCFYLWTPCQ